MYTNRLELSDDLVINVAGFDAGYHTRPIEVRVQIAPECHAQISLSVEDAEALIDSMADAIVVAHKDLPDAEEKTA